MTKKQNNYSKFSKEDLEEWLLELEQHTATKRKFKVLTGCKTNGWTDLTLGKICSDPECLSCSNFIKALKEEAKKWKI